ncbi:hypothetical protein CLV31_104119 [Algoriphagus aquaeductus]|uniref:Uncharacterized protein n=1 Tax=Algoriphagus aquaeductus TaxID=475299 RepID=A0A326RU76_9BACT|nr:hypothetical protein CLV31_104119 [Algoriphagus aquaeductus]
MNVFCALTYLLFDVFLLLIGNIGVVSHGGYEVKWRRYSVLGRFRIKF